MLVEPALKRPFDLVLSLTALVLLSPLLLVTAALIRLEDGGPALFVQDRVGQNGRLFRLKKFRSMPVDTKNLPSTAAGLRITRVGTVIRRTNVDELPQLLNIVQGDMSIVGPRPALPSQETLLEYRRQNGADGCKPGLTGPAQVNSYDGMPEREKADWDGWYRERQSLWLDGLLILRTFGYLARRPPTY